ncbi:hypothetical protein Peur_059980 [Populus x canadensis]
MESKAAAPPYQSSARFADSQCYPQYTASLKYANFQAWKSSARTKVNVKSILMFTRNARKRREKHGWNATRVAPSSHESCCGDLAHKKR